MMLQKVELTDSFCFQLKKKIWSGRNTSSSFSQEIQHVEMKKSKRKNVATWWGIFSIQIWKEKLLVFLLKNLKQ